MKKTIFLNLITIVIFSCQQQIAEERGPLEGVWERIATVNYENFKPVDTIPMEEKFSQIKIFTKNKMMFITNDENLDSVTGEDKFSGFAGYAESYDIKDNILTEYVSGGTDWFEEWAKKQINGVTFDVNISKNQYSQRFDLDSTGRGYSELWKRIE
tara:strand:+ start:190 stop:657 length:468 start_codon:yes stop_codon:yes gene_type:complete